ncbi:MAG: phosphate ABC transporter permease subunit PstC [Verrucomicrobia bacterium]|nr:phosphate ABC transporter permease subunit PstC [Verrucomicrobiota bacterium]
MKIPSAFSLQSSAFRFRIDLLRIACFLAAITIVATLGFLLYEILSKAWPAITTFGWRFIIRSDWQPNRDLYGVLPMLMGTLTSSLIALLLALPLGLAIAIFLSENFLPSPVRHAMRFIIDLLAAIPSVVYGLWGIFVIVPLVQKYGDSISQHAGSIPIFQGPAYGNSLLAASLVLALMVLPTITSLSRAALVAVPMVLREGSYALGATRWETIFNVLLPCATPGVVAAAILGFGRAMGETMAVAMLIGNSQRLTFSLFSPSNTLSALLANQFAEADGLQINALMYAALLLILMTLLVNLIGELILKKTQKNIWS